MIPLDRVREMLAAATPGPWGHYYDEDAGRPCVSCATPTGELCTYLVAVACSDMVEDAALIAAAPDLARDLLSLADALATAERERDAAQHTADTLGARYHAAWDTVDTMPPTASQSAEIAATLRVSYEAGDALSTALDALLSAAPPRSTVEARVVRAYLAAREAVPEGFDADYAGADERARVYALWDAVEVARAALDAALAAAEGTR